MAKLPALSHWCLRSIILFLSFLPHEEQVPIVQVSSAPVEIEGREDKQSRDEYERQMLVDPATGEIPYNIKRDEQVFARQRYQEQLLNPQPTSASGASANSKFGLGRYWT